MKTIIEYLIYMNAWILCAIIFDWTQETFLGYLLWIILLVLLDIKNRIWKN